MDFKILEVRDYIGKELHPHSHLMPYTGLKLKMHLLNEC